MGRRLHYVPDAIYSETPGQRNNAREAREVIKLIELHVRECPDKSLGVVTMNIPQMELIDELLIQSPEQVRAFCGDNSRFFLRNLETVQGDEMDRRRGFQCLKSLLRDLECSEQVQTFGISSERFKRRNDGVSNVVFCDSPFEEGSVTIFL